MKVMSKIDKHCTCVKRCSPAYRRLLEEVKYIYIAIKLHIDI